MKRFILAALLLCSASAAYAAGPPPASVPTYNYTHLAAAATTTVKAAPGLLGAICINTKGITSDTLTVYDNASAASGTVIAALDTTASTGCLTYNVVAKLGITVIIAAGTPADVTIAWR